MAPRFLQHAQHQARIVRLGILVQHAARSPRGGHAAPAWQTRRIDIAAARPPAITS
jgi:hypothetical protein